LYAVAQLLGSFLGYGLLRAITSEELLGTRTPQFCMTLPQTNVTQWQAFLVEFMITMGLILVCCGVWGEL